MLQTPIESGPQVSPPVHVAPIKFAPSKFALVIFEDVKLASIRFELGKSWIHAMETNLSSMEENLNGADKLKHKDDIQSNRDHLNSLKSKSSSEWREYATQCMVEIMNNKT